jgi:hypothetical protein
MGRKLGGGHSFSDVHAAADVEQDGQADGRGLRSKFRNRPGKSPVNHFEIALGEVGHEPPLSVSNRRTHRHEIDA